MENQQSPQTDQDVIDWILENLIEKSRTRRSVIKKMKELGLIFKAPTKRSNALAANKNAFMHEEDEKLRELYDEHRVESNCLQKIMEVFNKKRSKKAVVKRMVQLGLVADESEILPAKKPRAQKKGEEHRDSSSESDNSSSDDDVPAARPPKKTFALNNRATQSLRTELEESQKEAIDWIIESLKEAAEDFEEPSDDPDDAIPIVPFTEYQKAALENEQFKKLLESVNLQAPTGSESYWKIPANMMPADLNLRAKILAGEEVAPEQTVVSRNESDDDEDEDLFERLRAQREALMYNHSDAENEKRSVPSAKTNKKVEKVGKPNTKLLQQLLSQVTDEHSEGVEWIKSVLRDKASNKSSDAFDEMLLVPSTDAQKGALDDDKFKKLLVAINLTPPDGIESLWRIPAALSAKEILNRVDLLEIREESSDDDEMVIKRKKKPQQQSDELAINTQELKQRLADLDSSSDEENSLQATRKNALASSDDEEVAKLGEKRKSVKRDRSEISGDTPDENEMNATNNQHKRIRRIADSSDDE